MSEQLVEHGNMREKRTRTGRAKRMLARKDQALRTKRNAVVNPNNMNPYEVQTHHFRDARLYDETASVGFIVQNWVARKNFNNWLRSVRSQPGMEMFRRPKKVVTEEYDADDGTRVRFRSTIQHEKVVHTVRTVLPRTGNKKRSLLPGQAKNGEGVDAENYIPKMFTVSMGREIAAMRNTAGLTQAKLARLLNVTESHIKRVELGGLATFNPEDEFVKKLAQVLGVASIRYQD